MSGSYLDKVVEKRIRLAYGWDREDVIIAQELERQNFLRYLLNKKFRVGLRETDPPIVGAILRFIRKIRRYRSLKRYYQNILEYIDSF
jgi:hypothetical protein